MNSAKLFNKNYFIQNLKKSKGLIIFMTVLIPIFTTLMLFALASNGSYVIGDLETISAINMFGLYIFPVILSLALFSYVFKKKSVDFINSMPISKKTIFLTNTLGGIGILFLTIIMTLLLIIIVGISSSNILLVKEVCFDYLIYWFISYTFVFVATNLAISISGNVITSIAVTMLALFFIPFFCDYTSMYYTKTVSTSLMVKCEDKLCIPDYYNCYGDKACQVNKGLSTYKVDGTATKSESYTTPYAIFSNYIFRANNTGIYNVIGLAKTLILSIIYFGLGLYLFIHRKMEVCETSFKSFNTHLIVKGLTLMPIVFIIYEVIDYSIIGLLIFLALIITYYFVFDLITRKSIGNIKKSLLFLIVAILIWSSYAFIVNDTDIFKSSSKELRIDSNDVVAVKLANGSTTSRNLDNSYYKDRDLINLVLNYSYNSQYRVNSDSNYISYTFTLKLKNGDEYDVSISVPENKYSDFIAELASVSKVEKKAINFNFSKSVVLYFNNQYISDNKLLELIEKSAKNISAKDYYKNIDGDKNFGNLFIYSYDNNSIVKYDVSGLINDEITNYMADKSNEDLQDALSIKFNNEAFYINIISFESAEYNSDEYSLYFIDNMSKELYDFACKYGTEPFDISKPYAVISYNYTSSNMYRLFFTNRVDELEQIYVNKRNELMTTDEYKEYIKNSSKSSGEKNDD